ncbi:hypothetical protein SMRU11_23955 [Sinorhizobium meliloti RU11/001]|nr:hypothetical protein SMRU11_23955 [Sinorhizobium meliloti RU11/001]
MRSTVDEPVFCAETGRQISSDPASNVIPFRRSFEKPILAIDNEEDAARYARALTIRPSARLSFAIIDEAAHQELAAINARLAQDEDWI